jgi:two-component system cell cycle sensor histidine kinase PleC
MHPSRRRPPSTRFLEAVRDVGPGPTSEVRLRASAPLRVVSREPESIESLRQENGRLASERALLMAKVRTLRSEQRDMLRKCVDSDGAHRRKNELLLRTSHELRSPINSMIGFTELVLDEAALSDEHQKFLGDAVKSARHLLSVIRDLMDLAKLDAGASVLEQRPVSIGDVVAEACDLASGQGLKRRVVVERTIRTKRTVSADPRRLLQVLLNLLANAISFTPDNGVVHVRAVDDEAGIVVHVDDEGPGVPEGLVSQLFVPFSRLEGHRSRHGEGTGLGLAISKKILELHGATIACTRAPTGGARFSFRLAGAHGVVSVPVGRGAANDVMRAIR